MGGIVYGLYIIIGAVFVSSHVRIFGKYICAILTPKAPIAKKLSAFVICKNVLESPWSDSVDPDQTVSV